MAVAVAIWSMVVTPGEPGVISPPADVRITNVALGDELEDESGRTTVKLVYRTPGQGGDSDEEDEDEEDKEEDEDEDKPGQLSTTVLCSLTPGKIEQATVDVILGEEDEFLVEVVGKNTVYLTGNYIDQRGPDQDPYSDEESEEDFDLRDVSSDVEIDPEDLDIPSDDEGRFEEVIEDAAPAKDSKKRPRESDAMETDDGKLSKSQKKKQKKMKGADGEAVEAPTKPEEKKKSEEKGKKEKKEKADKAEKKAEPKTLQGGIQVDDHKVGAGPKAKAGDTVSMRYIGKLTNGKMFDQNTRGKPFTFHLGKGEVIKGWDIGIVGMQVGGERLLTIPAPMAYGKRGQPGIPGNSTLVFEVKLLEIK